MNSLKLQLNMPLNGLKAGETVQVELDADGVIKDKYWRRRFNDSKKDNCVQVLKPAKAKKETN